MGRDSQILDVWICFEASQISQELKMLHLNSWLIHGPLIHVIHCINSWLMQVVKNVKTLTDSCEIYSNWFIDSKRLPPGTLTTSTAQWPIITEPTSPACGQSSWKSSGSDPAQTVRFPWRHKCTAAAVRYYLQTGMFVNLASEAWKWRGIIYLHLKKSLKYVETLVWIDFWYRLQMIQIQMHSVIQMI